MTRTAIISFAVAALIGANGLFFTDGLAGGWSAQAAEAEHEEEGEDSGGHEREIHLTEEQLAQLNVRVGTAEGGSAEAVISAPATVSFNEDRTVRIGPRLPAKLVRVVKDLGEPVSQGEAIAILDSVALGKAKAQYLTAAARLEAAEAEYEREKNLAADQISSKAEMLAAKAAFTETKAEFNAAREELRLYGLTRSQIDAVAPGGETPLSRYVLTSPIAGIVQRRDAVPGETIGPDETPFTVVNTEKVWLFVDLFERNITKVAPGQSVTFSARALPDRRFEGKVDWVSKSLDEEARTVLVRAIVKNPDDILRDGMFGTARINTKSDQRLALVPVDAVQTLNEDSVVFVPGEEEGAFRARTVTVGQESDGVVEIMSGLEPGAEVVLSGAFDLMSALTASGRSAAHSH